MQKWYKIALSELGQSEMAGGMHNQRIVEYHSKTGLSANDDETPWCGAFVAWCFDKSGIDYNVAVAASARSWLKFGIELKKPTQGCVCVFTRGGGGSGHVGFYAGEDERGNILVLGGNQSNRVSIAPQSKSKLLGYRYPSNVKLPQDVKPLSRSRTMQGGTVALAASAVPVANEIKNTTEELRDVQSQINGAKEEFKMSDYFGLIISIVAILAVLFMMYARWTSNKS